MMSGWGCDDVCVCRGGSQDLVPVLREVLFVHNHNNLTQLCERDKSMYDQQQQSKPGFCDDQKRTVRLRCTELN